MTPTGKMGTSRNNNTICRPAEEQKKKDKKKKGEKKRKEKKRKEKKNDIKRTFVSLHSEGRVKAETLHWHARQMRNPLPSNFFFFFG